MASFTTRIIHAHSCNYLNNHLNKVNRAYTVVKVKLRHANDCKRLTQTLAGCPESGVSN